jgi:hypothetical protein
MMPYVRSGWHPPLLKWAASLRSRVLQLPYRNNFCIQFKEKAAYQTQTKARTSAAPSTAPSLVAPTQRLC